MNSFYLLQELPPTVLCRSPMAAQDRVSLLTSPSDCRTCGHLWLLKQFQVGPLGSIMFVSKHQFHSHSKVASFPSLPDTGYKGSSWSQRRGRRAVPAASFPALPSLWMVVRWRGRRKQTSFVTAPGLVQTSPWLAITTDLFLILCISGPWVEAPRTLLLGVSLPSPPNKQSLNPSGEHLRFFTIRFKTLFPSSFPATPLQKPYTSAPWNLCQFARVILCPGLSTASPSLKLDYPSPSPQLSKFLFICQSWDASGFQTGWGLGTGLVHWVLWNPETEDSITTRFKTKRKLKISRLSFISHLDIQLVFSLYFQFFL